MVNPSMLRFAFLAHVLYVLQRRKIIPRDEQGSHIHILYNVKRSIHNRTILTGWRVVRCH